MSDTPSKGYECGTKHGMLTVLSQTVFGRKAKVSCICECGGTKEVRTQTLKEQKNNGRTASCGCWTKARKKELGMQKFDFTKYNQQRFGRLLVTGIYVDPEKKRNKSKLVCLCDCGSQTVVAVGDLTTGHTTSCGCFHDELRSEYGKLNFVHGHTTFGVLNGHTPIYRAWAKIRAICAEGWRAGFHLVCHEYDPRWDDFQEFHRDFGDINRLQTISRYDRQLPWEKSNCFVNAGRRSPKLEA